jgi:bifunctional non-homologous end joining protein LigD
MPRASARSAKSDDRLSVYRAKRDFSKTSEPHESKARPDRQLIVQHHYATRDHFDLRLEIGGALVSWAVTRGPSANPKDRRLAVRTEDHPLDYGSFEGTIPKGQYGGGTVILWESATYAPANGDPAEALKKGEIKFVAHGERMRGGWVLVRMKGKEKRENWLLIKERDEYAESDDSLATRFPDGVRSHLTREQIEGGARSGVWSGRSGRKAGAGAALPAFVEPQLCETAKTPPEGKGWLAEMKYDGYRLQVAIGGGEVRIYTRSGLDWTQKFPEIVDAARALPCKSALLDGEAVVFDAQGVSDFAALVAALEQGKSRRIEYVGFDLLTLDGVDLRKQKLLERKCSLQELTRGAKGAIRYADDVAGQCGRVFEQAVAAGAEGIVAKRADSPYRSARSGAWLKVKAIHREDVLVVGYTPSTDGRSFASLIAAKEVGGDLVHIGRIGTGFNAQARAMLSPKLTAATAPKPPANLTGVTPAPRGSVFLKTPLRAEVLFGGWTGGGNLRHARFLGLSERQPQREAKTAKSKTEPAAKPATRPAGETVVTHATRVVYPADGVTKGEIAAYYERVAARMTPYLDGRLVSIVRAPDNIDAETFFQRRPMKGMTRGIEAVHEGDGEYIAIVGAQGLRSAAQFGAIEFHGWMSRFDNPDRPDRMIIDLDPAPDVPFAEVKRAARDIADHLAAIGVKSWPMITGGKGVHVVTPLDRSASTDDVVAFAQAFAQGLAEREPKRFIATMSKARRTGRIFIDWMRNNHRATAILPWSLRARAGAPVAVPLTWAALQKLDRGNAYDIKSATRLKDPWAKAFATGQAIPGQALDLARKARR